MKQKIVQVLVNLQYKFFINYSFKSPLSVWWQYAYYLRKVTNNCEMCAVWRSFFIGAVTAIFVLFFFVCFYFIFNK